MDLRCAWETFFYHGGGGGRYLSRLQGCKLVLFTKPKVIHANTCDRSGLAASHTGSLMCLTLVSTRQCFKVRYLGTSFLQQNIKYGLYVSEFLNDRVNITLHLRICRYVPPDIHVHKISCCCCRKLFFSFTAVYYISVRHW